MFRILCAHLATRRLVADVHIYPTGSVATLKALVLGKLAERDPSGEEHRVERWLFEPKAEGSEPSLAEIAEADDTKAVGALGLRNYSILYLEAPALPDTSGSLRPVQCFWDALYYESSKVSAVEITAIVVLLLSCGLEAALKKEDLVWWSDRVSHYEGATPLILAATEDRVDVVISLVAAGANVNAASSKKHTALHIAAQTGNVRLVEFLLSAGAELECRDSVGKTPLWHAAFEGNTGVIVALFAAGADVDAADNNFRTPLDWALTSGHDNVIKTLLAGGAKHIENRDMDNQTD